MTELPNGTYRVLIEGIERAEWTKYEEKDDYSVASITSIADDCRKRF